MISLPSLMAITGVRPVNPHRYTIDGVDDVRPTGPTRFACYVGGVHVGDIIAPEPPHRFEDGVWGWDARPMPLSVTGAF
jgi:hypothetical protein